MNPVYTLFFLAFLALCQSSSPQGSSNLKSDVSPIQETTQSAVESKGFQDRELAKITRRNRRKKWNHCKWDKFNALKDIVSGIRHVRPYSFEFYANWVYGRDYGDWEDKYGSIALECQHINGKEFIQGYTDQILSNEKSWLEKKTEYERICVGSVETDSQKFRDNIRHECKRMTGQIFGVDFNRWEDAHEEL